MLKATSIPSAMIKTRLGRKCPSIMLKTAALRLSAEPAVNLAETEPALVLQKIRRQRLRQNETKNHRRSKPIPTKRRLPKGSQKRWPTGLIQRAGPAAGEDQGR